MRTAAEEMLTTPARHPLSATVGEIRDFFRDDHVHAALIVSPAGRLEAVVERADIAGFQALDAVAAPLGRLAGRTVPAGASLADVRQAMTTAGRRRAAVTSADGRLRGLLCLKASRAGFCSDQDVRARALGEADPAAADATAPTDLGQLASQLPWPIPAMATVICLPQIVVSRTFSTTRAAILRPHFGSTRSGRFKYLFNRARCGEGAAGEYCEVKLATAGRGEIS